MQGNVHLEISSWCWTASSNYFATSYSFHVLFNSLRQLYCLFCVPCKRSDIWSKSWQCTGAADCETPLSLIQKHKKITITGPVLHLHVKVNYFLSYMDTVMLNNEVSVCAAKYSVSDSLFSALSNLESKYGRLLFKPPVWYGWPIRRKTVQTEADSLS